MLGSFSDRLDKIICQWSQNGSQIERPLKSVMAAFLVVIVATVMIQSIFTELRAFTSSRDEISETFQSLIIHKKAVSTETLTDVAATLGSNRQLVTAVIRRDYAEISRVAEQVIANFGNRITVADLTIYGANQNLLFRTGASELDKLPKAGSGPDMISALSRSTKSLEILSDGTLAATVLTPWTHNGRLLGYLKLAADIDGPLNFAAAAANAKLVKVNTAGKSSPKASGPVQADTHASMTFDFLGNRIASDAIIEEMVRGQTTLQKIFPVYFDNNKFLLAQHLPIGVTAAEGNTRLFVIRDITENMAGYAKGVLISLLASVLAAGLALFVFKRLLGRLQVAIRTTRTELEASVHANTQELERSQARLLEAQKIAAIGNWYRDIATGEMNGSVEFLRIMGIPHGTPPTEVRKLLYARIPERELEAVNTLVEQAIATCSAIDLEHTVIWQDGSQRHIHVRGHVIADSDGKAQRLVGTVHDITDRFNAERQNTLMATILETSLNEIYILNSADFTVEYANPCALKNLNYTADEAHALKFWEINENFTAQSVSEDMAPLFRGSAQSLSIEAFHQRKDGSEYPVDLRIHMLEDCDRRLLIAIANDVSERVQRENETRDAKERAERLAYFDPLTKLSNRAGCLRDAAQLFSGSEKPAFLVHVDMDNFKRVNDTLGHLGGDYCLAETGRRLREVSRGLGIPYRWGGDEFVILASSAASDPNELCERARRVMRVPMEFNGNTFWPTVSMGIALCPDHGTVFEDLLVNADLALYRSKNTGKDRFTFFAPDMQSLNDTEARLERELQMAVQKDEFFLVYQPQINMRSHKVTGVEALVRWRHPRRGVLSPGEFLPIVEKAGFSPILGEIVFDKAFAAARAWIDRGLDFGRISVNVSPEHLSSGQLLDQFKAAMKRHALTPDRITAEVLESVFLDDHGSCHGSTLGELYDMGVHVELDDFGTGYASLTHVADLPINGLKIDRSFTRQMLDDPRKEIVVNQLIHLARSLDIEVVCEGVETDAQYDRLRMMGDFSVQGFLMARPMPFEEASNWMAESAEDLYFVI